MTSLPDSSDTRCWRCGEPVPPGDDLTCDRCAEETGRVAARAIFETMLAESDALMNRLENRLRVTDKDLLRHNIAFYDVRVRAAVAFHRIGIPTLDQGDRAAREGVFVASSPSLVEILAWQEEEAEALKALPPDGRPAGTTTLTEDEFRVAYARARAARIADGLPVTNADLAADLGISDRSLRRYKSWLPEGSESS